MSSAYTGDFEIKTPMHNYPSEFDIVSCAETDDFDIKCLVAYADKLNIKCLLHIQVSLT